MFLSRLMLCLLPVLAAPAVGPRQEPTPPPAPQPDDEQPPAPALEPRPVTRDSLLRQLAAISRAARQLAEMAEGPEQQRLARRIAWVAEQMRADLSPETAAADGAAGRADPPAEAAPSGARAHPSRWQPVLAPEVVSTPWGTNVREAAEAAGGSRTFVGQRHRAVAPGGAVLGSFYEPHRDYTFRDCIFEGAPGQDGRIATRWGLRAYDVIDWRFLHCEWRNIPDEHGCYLSAPGSVLWSRCRFEGIGSQAIQVVYRWEPPYAHETSDPALRNLGGLHHVLECLFLECGKPSGGRPAYTLSFFEGPRCDVRIERSFLRTLESDHLDHEGLPSSSYGAIMVHDRPRVEILDTTVHYRRPDRPVIQVWNAEEVVIRGCEVVEGVIELRNCRRVELVGNTGSAQVRLGSGPAYVWPMPKVEYEGPLARDFER